MRELPRTIAITDHEGGNWIPFRSYEDRRELGFVKYMETRNSRTVHSIRFDDGSEWDTVNGWRTWNFYVRSLEEAGY